MSVQLRPYQQTLVSDIYRAWEQFKDVIAVLPTGGGKAYTLSYIVRDFASKGIPGIVMVHRRELLSQLSMSLATMGVMHNFIASKSTISFISQMHIAEFGRCFYSAQSNVYLASVQTLVKKKKIDQWALQFGLKVLDEAHHLTAGNSWGKCWEMFSNAKGLGVTATPARTSGEGLGRHADGYFDYMVLGPTMRSLINSQALCEYRVFAPPTDLNLTKLKMGSGGEYTSLSVEDVLSSSHVVGDAVTHYRKIMDGESAIVFASSVEKSKEIAIAFNNAGYKAMSVSSQDDDEVRIKAMQDFRSGKLQILSNYALYDEGLDVPGLVGVIDCAPTNSLIRFHQRFGRMLRRKPGKLFGIYIDMVGNVKTETRGTHALPDSPMLWSLDRRKKRSKEEEDNILKLTNCLNVECMLAYPSDLNECPHCGTAKPISKPRESSGPIEIDDNLIELTPATLAQLRGEILEVRQDSNEAMVERFGGHASGVIPMKWRKDHRQRKEALSELDDCISWWAGMLREYGFEDDQIRDSFANAHGMSIYHARTLKRVDAQKLIDKIKPLLLENGINV